MSGTCPAPPVALARSSESAVIGSACLRWTLLVALFGANIPAHASEDLWAALRGGGHVVLIRHASTVPGFGDPPGFRLDDCSTQRNLSDEGRAEAQAIGEAFRRHEIPVGEVLTSQWCRCVDTARLAFGQAEPWSALNSNYNDREQAPGEKNREARQRLSHRPKTGNLVLVTHSFNIRDLTGISVAQGEMVIVLPDGGGFRVLGTLLPF